MLTTQMTISRIPWVENWLGDVHGSVSPFAQQAVRRTSAQGGRQGGLLGLGATVLRVRTSSGGYSDGERGWYVNALNDPMGREVSSSNKSVC